jgi:predicted N-formylglutamate amidohydrolase
VPTPEQTLLLTCEHAGKRVPRELRARFAGRAALLASHRGWDPGALLVARSLAASFGATLLAATATRLLVDSNRSPHNPAVFSEFTRSLPREARLELLDRHHRPHWDRVRAAIASNPGTTLHVAVHSFTPQWQGATRNFAVGILYDPKRRRERSLASDWQRRIREQLPAAAGVRRNAPYRGDTDGLTTAMRREFPAGRYLGLELELNQGWLAPAPKRRALVAVIATTLRAAATARR